MVYNNALPTTQTYELNVSEMITKKSCWSFKTGIESTINVSVKGNIPQICEVTAGWSIKAWAEATYSKENTTAKVKTWKFPVTVPGNSNVRATVTMGVANIDLPYTGKINN